MRGSNGNTIVPPNKRVLTYLYSRHAYLVYRAEQLVTTMFAMDADHEPLTVLQFHILQILQAGGEMPQARIARISGSDPSTTSLVLKNLAKAGLIDRTADLHDRRQKLVRLTNPGSKAAQDGCRAMEALTAILLAPLGKAQSKFVDLLARLSPIDLSQLSSGEEHGGDGDATALLAVLTSAPFALRRALQVMDAKAAHELAPTGITIRQFAVLLLVHSHPGITEAALVRYGGFEASNAAFLLKLLRENGKIALAKGSEGRRKRYLLTPTGLESIHKAGAALVGAEYASVGALKPREASELRQMLARVIAQQNRGSNAAMPVFPELTEDPQWPIEAGELNFASEGSDLSPADWPDAAEPGEAVDGERQSLLLLLKRAELAVRNDIERLLDPLDLSAVQFLALGRLGHLPGLSNADIARLMGITPQSSMALMAPLIERGLVGRRAEPGSGRRLQLFLTDKGRETLDAGQISIEPIEANLLNNISSQEEAVLRRSLQIMIGSRG